MKTLLITVLLIICLLYSCSEDKTSIEYNCENFTITVPEYMIKSQGRTEDSFAEFVIDTTKNTKDILNVVIYKDDIKSYGKGKATLSTYYKFVADDILDKTLESGSLNAPKEIKINGLPAMIFEITGSYHENKQNYEYLFVSVVIESPDNFYEITTWTLFESSEKYKSTMEDIMFSFKLVE